MAVRIIISPAKKMNVDTDSLPWRELPQFLPEAERLRAALRKLSYDELKALWGCNDKLAALNYERLQAMELEKRLTPALLSYEGLQYRYMAPSVFTYAELDYVQEHLRVLSGFYGLLRPFDGVAPYRLEMQANLSVDGYKDLYAFWGSRLAQQLLSESDTILNLSSKEYSKVVTPYLPPQTRFVTCVFAVQKDGKLLEQGSLCKMARGGMVRFLAERQSCTPVEATQFDRLGFRFHAELSNETTYTFVKEDGPCSNPE